jgi:hypothetical protein
MSRSRPARRAAAGTPSSSKPGLPRWADAILLAALLATLAAWSWRKWPELFVDYGHELYVPWQLAEGRVLYRDIVYFMGPLSQYFNAVMFTAFGVSFRTLIFVNLAILGAITWMIHSLFSRALGRAAGVTAAAVFLCVFAFGHYVRFGNYNYVTPYLHEQTHGVALGLLLLVLLERAARLDRWPLTAGAGFALGLTFLTKAEAFVPALAASFTAGALLLVTRRPPAAVAARRAALFTAGAAVPVGVAVLLLATGMPIAAALRAVIGNWIYLLDRELVLDDPFYAENLGLADSRAQLGVIGGVLLRWAGFAAVALGLERLLRGRGRGACVAAAVLVAALLIVTTEYMTWLHVVRPLPLLCAGAAVVFALRARKGDPAGFLLALWSVFALASLGKMLLKTRIEHYGFALAMPGTLLLVAMVVFVVPQWLRQRGWSGDAWRATAAATVLVAVGWLLSLSNAYYSAKTLPVGSGADLVYGFAPGFDVRTAYFAAALETLSREMPRDSTLAVLPDGALLNFLLRRPNPTPYYLITPWEMRAFGGEDAIFARIAPTAPEYFVLCKLDMSEFGVPFFGVNREYGQRTRLWLAQNYDIVAGIGEDPATRQPWLEIYRRRDGHAASTRLPEPALGS